MKKSTPKKLIYARSLDIEKKHPEDFSLIFFYQISKNYIQYLMLSGKNKRRMPLEFTLFVFGCQHFKIIFFFGFSLKFF